MQELELSRWELESIAPSDSFATVRTDQPVMVWTPVEELDAFMLNLFAPREQVFWNLRDYRAFQAGNVAYVEKLARREDTRSRLNDLITESGAERNSDFAYLLLGGLTRRYGDRYFPDYTTALSQSAGRHLSILVPAAQHAAVARYFQRQHAVFGASAFRPCPDGIGVGLSDDRTTLAFQLLQQPADALRPRDRQALVATVASVRAGQVILPLLLGHPDKRFNIAIRSETDEQEEIRRQGGTQALQRGVQTSGAVACSERRGSGSGA